MIYAEVIVDINHNKVDKVFDYRIPERLHDQAAVGKRVLVPFNNKKIVGFIMELKKNTEIINIKDIFNILDQEPIIAADLVELTKWISRQYFCQQIQVLKGLVPEKVKNFKNNEEKLYFLAMSYEERLAAMEKISRRAPVQYAILNFLEQAEQPVQLAEITSALGQVSAPLKALVQKGLVKCEIGVVDHNPYQNRDFVQKLSLQANQEQEKAIAEITAAIYSNKYASYLLHGITGSGKTEVYLQAIANALQASKDAIVLVPEISLTPQTVARFKERFGNLVAVFHSRLSPSEKMDQWWKIKSGQVKIVVGARSAIFAPFKKLGLIIIDEEHESTYKQEETPRYHTKEVALKRAELTNSVVVMGSATPSLETYFETVNSKHKLLTLTKRPKENQLPKVQTVDLREELRLGNRSIFSRVLHKYILETIAKREQIILFLNRRGHSTFVNCRECGYVAKCPNCAVSLTLHSVDTKIKCHYCDYAADIPQKCPSCGSSHIRHFGIGTQKVEEEVKKIFTHARVLRMDIDTTRKKGSHQKILDLFQQGRADILIGTQMIAKGLDFPKVSLVGILAADLSLNIPDFRACERTFQLAAQVAGRAGRDEVPGKVIIQTYSPENYAIKCAQEHDYHRFYQLEIEQRKKFAYPPFTSLMRILAVGHNADVVQQHLGQIHQQIKELIAKEHQPKLPLIEIIGPLPAPINKLRNQYRWHMLLKGIAEELFPEIKKIADFYYNRQEQVKIIVDVNPIYIM